MFYFYFIYSLLLLIFSLLAVSVTAQLNENNLKCLLTYLKEDGLIEQSSFPLAPYSGNKAVCKKFIDGQTQKIMNEVKSTFDEGMSAVEIKCVLTDLEEQFYADYALKDVVYNSFPGMVRSERMDMIEANQKKYEGMLEKVLRRCGDENLFNNNFIKNSFKSVTPQTMYCLRRYIIEKDLINTRKIKVYLNPTRINLKGIKCSELNAVQFQRVEDEFKGIFSDNFSEEKVQCMIEKFKENKFGNIIVAIKLLKDFNITDYQIAGYRKRFEDMMDSFGVIAQDC